MNIIVSCDSAVHADVNNLFNVQQKINPNLNIDEYSGLIEYLRFELWRVKFTNNLSKNIISIDTN